MTVQPIAAISFSSSGVLMIGQMGIYCQLYEAGRVATVKDFYGCSGGSICAYLCALGVTPVWIREWVQHFDTRPIMNIQEDMVVDYLTTWGVDSGIAAKEYISKFINTWEPGASEWTFADLANRRSGVRLTITATNVTAECQQVFSIDTHPSMRIADAIQASSSVPFYSCPWIDSSGQILCDGAIFESYPFHSVRDPANTLFIVCEHVALSPVTASLGDYIHKILRIMRFGNRTEPHPAQKICLKSCGIMLLNFMISKEERLRLFASGLADGAEWLMQHSPAETAGSLPCSGDLHTLSAGRPSPERSLDSHQWDTPLPPQGPSPDLLHGRQRRYRRWSV